MDVTVWNNNINDRQDLKYRMKHNRIGIIQFMNEVKYSNAPVWSGRRVKFRITLEIYEILCIIPKVNTNREISKMNEIKMKLQKN